MNALMYRSDELRARRTSTRNALCGDNRGPTWESPWDSLPSRSGRAHKHDSSDRGAKPAPAKKSSLARFTSFSPAGTEVW